MRSWHGNLSPFGSWHTASAVASFSPSSLFALSEPGVWYDPSDLTTMFTDTAGTTQAAVGQAVALVLDKSKGLVLGPELVTNGTFDANVTGWTAYSSATISWSDGRLRMNITTSQFGRTGTTITTVVGKTYAFTGNTIKISGGVTSLQLRKSDSEGNFINGVYSAGGFGEKRLVFVATSTTTYIQLEASGGTSSVVELDNISVKELPGFHATQSTTTARPILARIPEGGRRNLFLRTEEFDNAYWTKDGATTPVTNNTAPDGAETAETLTETATTGIHGAYRVPAGAFAAGTYTLSCYFKQGTARYAHLLINTGSSGNYSAATFDLQTGSVTKNEAPGASVTSPAPPTIVDVGNGWYRATITATSSLTLNAVGPLISNSGTPTYTNSGGVSYAGNTANNILIWGAQLELGSTATAYQKVVSTYDVTEAGKADLYHLVFDGTDDWLVTPTITPGIDKAQVFAGVRKLSDATIGTLVELSTTSASNNGSLTVLTPDSPQPYSFASRGTTRTFAAALGTFAAPITNVLTGIGDIAGDNATLRINGVQNVQNTADQGTGNYLAYPLYIGRRGGTTLPFNGHLYSLVVRFGANLDAGTISATERYVGGKTGVVLP